MTPGAPALICVVDDDPAMRHSTCFLLRALGWEAEGFANGEAYLASLQTRAPDCVLLDLHLPGINYPEIIERARALHAGIAVIAITGDAEDSAEAAHALRLGAVEVLGKPMSEAALSAAIERQLALRGRR